MEDQYTEEKNINRQDNVNRQNNSVIEDITAMYFRYMKRRKTWKNELNKGT